MPEMVELLNINTWRILLKNDRIVDFNEAFLANKQTNKKRKENNNRQQLGGKHASILQVLSLTTCDFLSLQTDTWRFGVSRPRRKRRN